MTSSGLVCQKDQHVSDGSAPRFIPIAGSVMRDGVPPRVGSPDFAFTIGCRSPARELFFHCSNAEDLQGWKDAFAAAQAAAAATANRPTPPARSPPAGTPAGATSATRAAEDTPYDEHAFGGDDDDGASEHGHDRDGSQARPGHSVGSSPAGSGVGAAPATAPAGPPSVPRGQPSAAAPAQAAKPPPPGPRPSPPPANPSASRHRYAPMTAAELESLPEGEGAPAGTQQQDHTPAPGSQASSVAARDAPPPAPASSCF